MTPIISLDVDGDGQEDRSVAPNVVLAADEREDRVPPATRLVLAGTLGENNTYVSSVTASFEASDAGGSGVRGTRYTTDGGQIWQWSWLPADGPVPLPETCRVDLRYRSQDFNFQSEATQSTEVRIDRLPPVVASFTASPSVLWPPNHQLVEVIPSAVITDNCTPAVAWQIESIRMNEGDTESTYDPVHDQWLEEGFTSEDIQVVGGRILLRAERKGSSAGGRVYTLTLRTRDDAGHVTRAQAQVTVPHDQR